MKNCSSISPQPWKPISHQPNFILAHFISTQKPHVLVMFEIK